MYLLLSPLGTPIAGNLNSWPRAGREAGSWVQFDTQARVGGGYESHPVRAALIELAGGYRLLVGTDMIERVRFERVMKQVGAWAVVLIVVLGAFIGVAVNRRLLRQVNRVAAARRDIADGDCSGRLPLAGLWAAGTCVHPDVDHRDSLADGRRVGARVVAELESAAARAKDRSGG